MSDERHDAERPTCEPIALRPREAAKALGIGERTLWGLTAPRGPIPVVKVGMVRLYRVADLDSWLVSRLERGG